MRDEEKFKANLKKFEELDIQTLTKQIQKIEKAYRENPPEDVLVTSTADGCLEVVVKDRKKELETDFYTTMIESGYEGNVLFANFSLDIVEKEKEIIKKTPPIYREI